jgi:hypothetical protein
MTEDTLIQILTGPVAALALCISAIFYIGRWIATHLPIWVDKHLEQIDHIVESHNEDRKVYREGLETLNTSMKELNGEVHVLKDDVKDIKDSLTRSQVDRVQ